MDNFNRIELCSYDHDLTYCAKNVENRIIMSRNKKIGNDVSET
jgi:hypothetical protein